LAGLHNLATGLLQARGETNIARGLRRFTNQPQRVIGALGSV